MGAREVFGMESRDYVVKMKEIVTSVKDRDLGGGKSHMFARKSSTGIRTSENAHKSSWEKFGVDRDPIPQTAKRTVYVENMSTIG